jgi:hypothetical protein
MNHHEFKAQLPILADPDHDLREVIKRFENHVGRQLAISFFDVDENFTFQFRAGCSRLIR